MHPRELQAQINDSNNNVIEDSAYIIPLTELKL